MGPRQSRKRDEEAEAAIYHYDEPPTQPGTRKTVAGVCQCRQHTRNLRVLSIDGGGVRGLMPLYFLAMLEERTGKSCTDLFDMFAGTSVGGLIVMSLNVPDPESDPPRPKHSARQLYDWFKENAPLLFPVNNTSRDVRSLQGMIGARCAFPHVRSAAAEACAAAHKTTPSRSRTRCNSSLARHG
eukprot:Unigene5339_Nuclearia_a/m.16374 Unigene5339_Nuclearia_a/g.16374  ORF Unigene5339_Nuclearia_a/g.16374 Unigene5339_Nuclearia_a/m.16374 type:complete len:184 (-) Unigene5339_Nuclearia_a:1020-1571(-)